MIKLSHSHRKLSLMFWAYNILGLVTILSMAGFVAWQLGKLTEQNGLAQAKQEQLQRTFSSLHQRGLQAHANIALMLSEDYGEMSKQERENILIRDSLTGSYAEIENFARQVADSDILEKLVDLKQQFDELNNLTVAVVRWYQTFSVVSDDIDNSITLGKVRGELRKLREAVDVMAGQHKLELAVLTREWRQAQGQRFIDIAKKIREQHQWQWPRELIAVKDEMSEISYLVEMLVAAPEAINLVDIRDNKLKPSFERLMTSVRILSQGVGSNVISISDVNHLAELFFGRGYYFDSNSQSVVLGDGGLYQLEQQHHELSNQLRQLTSDFHQHEKLDASTFQTLTRLESRYVKLFGVEAQNRLRDALNKMLLWFLVLFVPFALLVWLIFRNIGLQFQEQIYLKRQNESILNSAVEGVVGLDASGNHLFVNQSAAVMFDSSASEFSQYNNREFWEKQSGAIDQVLNGEKGVVLTEVTHFKRMDGSTFEVEYSAVPMKTENSITGVVVTFRDITENQRIKEALKESESKFRGLSEKSLAGIYVIQGGVFSYVNPRFAEIFGYQREEVEGKLGPFQLVHPDDQNIVKDNINERIKGKVHSVSYSIRGVRKDGDIIHIDLLGSGSTFNGKPAIIGTLLDTSLRKEAEEKVKNQAYYDQLTGLPNRRLFNDRLGHAIKNAQRERRRVALLFLDLDRFKKVNDSLGHPIGDGLLQTVALRVRQAIRENDTLARLGGDEFAIVLECIQGPETAAYVAQKVLKSFDEPFDVSGHNLFISTTIGLCLYPDDGEDANSMIKHADVAMYQAKRWGRATYAFYKPQMTAAATEWLALETALRKAIEHNQLLLHFQPQVDLSTGDIVGAEALIRWQHPERGLIPPDKFIPLAEESGMILEIGDWVLREACYHIKAWQDEGLNFGKVAVNLSGIQVVRGNVLSSTKSLLSECGVSPHCLELEITENSIMEHTEEVLKTLNGLRKLGVSLAIDDFGTGYSSLSYLKQLPIDKLKIDRSFVTDIPRDSNDVAITKAVISLGKVLGLDLVAEGVETLTQSTFLLDNGCVTGQGYLFSPPVPAEVFTQCLRAGKCPGQQIVSA